MQQKARGSDWRSIGTGAVRSLMGGLLAVSLGACGSGESLAPPAEETAVSTAALEAGDSYIAVFREGVAPDAKAARLARAHGLGLRFVYGTAVRGFSFRATPAAMRAVAADPDVLYVEPNGVVSILGRPTTEARPGSGGGETVPWGITRVGGPGTATSRTAWVIDTGIDFEHADLNVDTARSKNFVTTGKNTADDGNGHGTHVAGTIAAKDNDIDVIGVAPGNVVVAVRVLDNSGSGTWDGVIAGVDYVAANGASGDVANMSLGGSGSNKTLEDAVRNAASKGIRFAIAAGNDGSFAGDFTPARVDATNVYTVSAINSSDCMPSWSNWGNPPVDYAAPGVSVLSTKNGGGTTTYSGTSMATPHVAGILLLGSVRTDGYAGCDPDGKPDPIAHR